ncbi:hypothetical protein MtrunA17_Chr6g0450341 [Medicago truncatula]|uniref:Transmembrane protein, putative n=1 Tax=Medicago truncatula TaxID=3880 RepID=G7KI41_MEDTR|nr:transmembrane protein, putative [Medicago truncatula]RHN49787.1 hypothetical protein MtrunA17_Chr6g0450341 [Medicago truncatula]
MAPRIPNAHKKAKTPIRLKHCRIYIAFHEILIWWLPNFYMLLLVLYRCCWCRPHFLPLKKRFMCMWDNYINDRLLNQRPVLCHYDGAKPVSSMKTQKEGKMKVGKK